MYNFLQSLFTGMLAFIICELTTKGLKRFRKPIFITSQWYPVETIPKHKFEDPDYIKIIITDGTKVDTAYSNYFRYNCKGQIVFGYDEKIITHWQYLPSPPKK